MRHVLEPASKDPEELLDRYSARNRVIRAAKAYWAGINGLPGSEEPEDVWLRLNAAVEALQEAEDDR